MLLIQRANRNCSGRVFVLLLAASFTVAAFSSGALAAPCVVPDKGTGTVTLLPEGCEYLSPDEVHMIIDGLPPGTAIELAPIHKDFICDAGYGFCTIALPPWRVRSGGRRARPDRSARAIRRVGAPITRPLHSRRAFALPPASPCQRRPPSGARS